MGSIPKPDNVQLFFLHCHEVLKETRFILSSLPNVDPLSTERSICQMHAIHRLLEELEDPWISKSDIESLIWLVLRTAAPLQLWLDSPCKKHHPSQCPQQLGQGRPHFIIDLDHASELHDMDLTWKQIASAMGVSQGTLYNHFHAAGRSTARQQFLEINESDLIELITDVAQRHPLSGSVVVQGHLEALGVHVLRERIRESLRKIDAIGVSLQSVLIKI